MKYYCIWTFNFPLNKKNFSLLKLVLEINKKTIVYRHKHILQHIKFVCRHWSIMNNQGSKVEPPLGELKNKSWDIIVYWFPLYKKNFSLLRLVSEINLKKWLSGHRHKPHNVCVIILITFLPLCFSLLAYYFTQFNILQKLDLLP